MTPRPRARDASAAADTRALVRALERGAILGITPDLIAGGREGVAVRLFGRTVRLRGGAVGLARRAGAPLLFFAPCWRGTRFSLRWHRLPDPPRALAGNEAVRRGLQAWCDLLEGHVERHPEDWLFWLDKRWVRAVRTPPGPG